MKTLVLVITASLLTVAINSQACDVAPKGTCYVEETHQYVSADRFFSLVSEKAAEYGVICTVGRVKGKQSGRMYNTNGARIEKSQGCLSHKEIKEIKAAYNLTGECKSYTCSEM